MKIPRPERGIVHQNLQSSLNSFLNLLHADSRLESADNIALTVNEELGEIPLDVVIVLVVLVHSPENAAHSQSLWAFAEAGERSVICEELEQRESIIALNVDF